MTLATEAKATTNCKVCDLAASVDDQLRSELLEALADPDVTDRGLARALYKRGHSISTSPIEKHKRENHVVTGR